MEEIWKNIKDYEGYQISNLGRIKSKYIKYGNKFKLKKEKEHILKSYKQNKGYLLCTIKNKKKLVHRLVAETFIPNPNNFEQVNHIDGNKLNNCVDNLEWVNRSQNMKHAFKIGLCKNTILNLKENKPRARKIMQLDKNKNKINEFKGSVEAMIFLKNKGIKINASNIRKVCNGERKSAGGYLWEYVS